MNTDDNRTRFVTPNEVADMLRVSSMTVYRLIKSGEMRAIKVGEPISGYGRILTL